MTDSMATDDAGPGGWLHTLAHCIEKGRFELLE